jgi:predicted nucleic acid-binding protein
MLFPTQAASSPFQISICFGRLQGADIRKNMGLAITGTIGIIIKSHELGLIEDALDVIRKLRVIGFRIPPDIL